MDEIAHQATILVVDDDVVVRQYVQMHLASANFIVRLAEDGASALAMALRYPPDLILTDLSMPNMDGFDLVEQLRAHASLADIPIILLTQHDDVSSFRRAMDLGADDFLAKPVRRNDLLGAISSRLKRLEGIRARANTNQASTTEQLAMNIKPIGSAGDQPSMAEILEPAPTMLLRAIEEDTKRIAQSPGDVETMDGTVLFSDIRNFTTYSQKLTADEVAEMLNAYFGKACEPILDQSGWVVKFVGDGVIAMFDNKNSHGAHHAERAVKAALLIVAFAHRFDAWIKQRFPQHDLPAFAIGVGLHSGSVSVCKISSATNTETTVIGDTVNVASRLEAQTKERGWSVVASDQTMQSAGKRFLIGRSQKIIVKGRTGIMEIVEICGLVPHANVLPNAGRPSVYDAITAAVAANSAILQAAQIARSAEGNTAGKVGHADNEQSTEVSQRLAQLTPNMPKADAIKLDGYRLLRKLGEGGMSQVFLAEQTSTGEQQVLKLIKISDEDEGEMLQRFITEYALVSQIEHINIAKIYHQGFSKSHAYIAMEYFPGGDLRKLIKSSVTFELANAVLMQIAGALGAIHEKGIVHRDMKPDNIMIRADGSLALADFGIAIKSDTHLNLTAHGSVFGTPSYIAPEQAQGLAVDHRADLYSLGVMFFELLAGKKPFRAPNPQTLLYQHVNAPIPELPAQFSSLQPLINKMMAKDPNDRFANAGEIIDEAISASAQSF